MKKLYRKLIQEIIRYIHLRASDQNEIPDINFTTPDKINISEKIQVDLNVFRDMDSTAETGLWLDMVVYEKIRSCFIRVNGWIILTDFGKVVYPDISSRCYAGDWFKIPSQFSQCRWDIGFILYLYEAFYKLGGRKKEMETLYYKLSVLNASLI